MSSEVGIDGRRRVCAKQIGTVVTVTRKRILIDYYLFYRQKKKE